MTQDRLPPHSQEAEQGVLACCLIDPARIDDCVVRLKAGATVFYDLRHQTIYSAMVELREAGQPVDAITLGQRLRESQLLEQVGGIAYIMPLQDTVPSASNLPDYLAIVIEKSRLRKLLRTCTDAVCSIYESNGNAVALLTEILFSFQNLDGEDSGSLDGKSVAVKMLDDLQRRFDLQGQRSGLATGLHEFDRLTDGLQFGEQAVIAARPSHGKTAIACNIIDRVCLIDQQPTIFVTLEMSPAALSKRLLSSWGKVPMNALRSGLFTEDHFRKFSAFQKILAAAPLHVVDGVSGMNSNQVAASIRRIFRKHAIRFVVIDYLQKIKSSTRNEKRNYEVAEVSGVLKSLAVETGAAFLTLAQLNREPTKDKGRLPRLSDLADSGQIERDADLVALLHLDVDKTKASLIVSKQRDGETGLVQLAFNGSICKFDNPNPISQWIKTP